VGPFGPAYARNRGAEAARGKILFFVDADVHGRSRCIAPDRDALPGANQTLAAAFGSYDALPEAQGVVSRYRNLLHHFVHAEWSIRSLDILGGMWSHSS